MIRSIFMSLLLFASTIQAEVFETKLKIVFVDDYKEIPKQWYFFNKPQFLGMSNLDNLPEECILYVMKPDDWNDKLKMEIIGHELMHCHWGEHTAKEIQNKRAFGKY